MHIKNVDTNTIADLSNDILGLIRKREMINVHAILALEAVRLSLNEQFIKDVMEEHKQEQKGLPGVS